jgi:hypothetical protein
MFHEGFKINSLNAEKASKGDITFTVDYESAKELRFSLYNPPNGDVIMKIEHNSIKPGKGTVKVSLSQEEYSLLLNLEIVTMRFGFEEEHSVISFGPAQLKDLVNSEENSSPRPVGESSFVSFNEVKDVVQNKEWVISFSDDVDRGIINHQSSTVVYAEIDNMKPVSLPIPFASHSFEQQIIAAPDEGFTLVDRGDGSPRGFQLSRVSEGILGEFDPFHFAENTVYQITRSDLGGIAENSYAYILSGSSIKLLTYDPVLGSKPMAMDIFVQSIKKNFIYHSNDSDKLLSKGETRIPSGTIGKLGLNLSVQSCFLPPDVVDYGVVWLTDYQEDEAAVKPKVVAIQDDLSVVLWEKYKDSEFVDTYYAVVNYAGEIVKRPTVIPKARLCEEQQPPVYSDGNILWSVTNIESCTITVYKLKISASTPDQLYSNCYSAVLKAQQTGLQWDINLARKAQNALIGTEAEWAVGEFSRQIDQLQQPILVNICEAIDKIQAQAKSDTINQIDINSARRFIPVDLDPYWRNSYSSAIDLVQQQLMKKTKDAYDKAVKSGLKSDIDEVNALVSNLSKADDISIREWAKSFSL